MIKQSHGEKTRLKILNAGVELWPDVTLSKVADKINMTHAAVLYHFPMGTLKNRVAEHAVAIGESRVIVQLIAKNHPAVDHMTAGEKSAHFFTV